MGVERFIRRGYVLHDLSDELVRSPRFRQRFIGEHEAMSQHVGRYIHDILGQYVIAASQVGQRACAFDEVNRRAWTRTV